MSPLLNKPNLGLDGLLVNRNDLDSTPWSGGLNLDGTPRT